MQIRFDCPTDTCVAIIELEPLEECDGTIECPRCHQTHSMTITPAMRADNTPDRCAVCNGTEMFVRKDFPQALGVAVVVVFGLAALYFFTINVLIAWSILVSAALIDLLVYLMIGQVTTCYACRAGYRKCNLNPAHDGFDLATAEKY